MATETLRHQVGLELQEEGRRRESDQSEDEESEELSEVSSEEEEEEEEQNLLLQGRDVTVHKRSSDGDDWTLWEPDSPIRKRQRLEVEEEEEEEEEDGTFSGQKCSASRRTPRGHQSRAELSSSTSGERWNDVRVPDVIPPQPTFRPCHSPGPRLARMAVYSPLQLFQLFFSNSVLQTIVQNTNDFGSAHHATPSEPWTDLTLQDMFSFLSLVVYMGVVKCTSLSDYWRGGKLYGLPFPKAVMTRRKFLRICRSLHLSSPAVDADNEKRRGTVGCDRLCKIKPLYEEMRDACKRNYHPAQEISVDERAVASHARGGLRHHVKHKPVKGGFKLLVLADSSNGYIWDFSVCEGKGFDSESVTELLNTRRLGTGYKLFVDTLYTSPALFRDLLHKRIWACGTSRNKSGFPKTTVNSLDSKSACGSLRWIRRDSLLFVQWRDTRDVSLCSTIHTAHSDDTVQRRVKGPDGQWTQRDVPVPPAVTDYNRCSGGVDLSDALVESYKVPRRTQKWYKTFFYHLVDVAIANAYLLHRDLSKGKGEAPLYQKTFRETLAEQLAAVGSGSTAHYTPPGPPPPRGAHHRAVHISGHSTAGRLKCRQCHAKTPVKCSSCDTPLCFVPGRDCYNEWHVSKNL